MSGFFVVLSFRQFQISIYTKLILNMTKKEKSEATEKKKIVKRRTTRRKKEVKTKKTKSKSNTSSESKTLDSKKTTLESKTRKSKSASKSGVTTSSIKSTDSTKKRRSRTTIEEVSSKRIKSKKTKTIKSKKTKTIKSKKTKNVESKKTKNVESKKTKKIESNNIDSKIKFKHIDINKVDADLVGRVYNIDDSPLGGIYQNKKKFQFITSTGQMLESSVLGELISQLKPLKWCRIKWRQNKRFNVCDHTKESTMKPSVYVDTEWVSEVRDSLKA